MDNSFEQFEKKYNYVDETRLNKVHIGLLQLNTDHTLEYEWRKMAGDEAIVFSNRIAYSGQLTAESLGGIKNNMAEKAGEIAYGLELDVMAFGCTSASVVIGDDNVAELMTKHHKGLPVSNPWLALKQGLKHLNAKTVAVLSPYPTAINKQLHCQLQQDGIEVVAFGAFGVEYDIDIVKISQQSIMNALDDLMDGVDADCIFMSCTSLRAAHLIEKIEKRFGVPALSSNTVMYWHTMKIAGKPIKKPEYGAIFS